MTTATDPGSPGTTDTRHPPATFVTCPSCHTARPGLATESFDSGEQWRCERCGERWTRSRLATVAEYEAWALEYGRS